MSQAPPPEVSSEEDDDSGVPLSSTKLEDAEMDIAPMIDCTFLLLIFFIVCSNVGQSDGVELPKARYGVAVPAKNSVVLTVAAGDSEHCRVYKGDGIDSAQELVGATLAEQEDAIAQYVAEKMSSDKVFEHILVKGARNLKHREVSRVCKAAVRNVELGQLFIAVTESD